MEILWAPWRTKYIGTFKDEEKKNSESCFFCDALAQPENARELLVVRKEELSFAMLNKFPYNNGHTLIAPIRHIGELDELSDAELISLIKLVKKTKIALDRAYKPHGHNIGVNVGRAAGAGVPGHLHFHIVPRWNGDTSYTAVISDTKIVSLALDDTWQLLHELLNEE